MNMAGRKFESKCSHCDGRITGNLTSWTWRHDTAPADKHRAVPTGTVVEI